MDFQFGFFTIIVSITKLFILMAIGYFLHMRKFIDDKFTDMLSLLLVRVFFPALIISKTISNFSFTEYSYWWILPLSAMIFSVVGMVAGKIVHSFWLKGFGLSREFMCSCGFQNCGYLPMNLILFSFAGAVGDKLLVYLFLFILGFNVIMWSLVPLFLKGGIKKGFKLQVLFNPPVVATVFSLIWVALMGKGSLPNIVAAPIEQLGQASFSIAMITLGSYLCRYKAHDLTEKKPIIASVVTKLFIFPVIVLSVLRVVPLDMSYKFFLFLQATMPAAVSLVVIGSYTGANNEFFSRSIFYTHVVAILSVPLWLYVFKMIII